MRRTLGIALAVSVLFASAANDVMAQEEKPYLRTPHRVHIFADGGIVIPASPAMYKDFWNATLPFRLGAGGVIFSWLDVNGVFTYEKFSNNHVRTKQNLGYTGIGEVEGGEITTIMIMGTVRFLAVPNARANPYVEVGVGTFNTRLESVIIVDPNSIDQTPELERTGEDVSGITFASSGGLQYALNERWSTYVKYTFTMNLNEDFNPGTLVGDAADAEGGNQLHSSLSIGMMIRF